MGRNANTVFASREHFVSPRKMSLRWTGDRLRNPGVAGRRQAFDSSFFRETPFTGALEK